MWRDEVRAFSVAIHAPTWGSLFALLHYEGHPVLWYVILRAGYGITHSNAVLPVAAALVGVATAWLMLRYAPYPLWLRLLAVFGTFLVYEITVVARNYGVGVFFMIIAAMTFSAKRSPLLLAFALVLMANTSVHAALAALVLLGLWTLYTMREPDGALSVQGIVAIALTLGGVALALWTARPTPNMAWAITSANLSPASILETILRDPGISLRGVYDSNIAASAELPWSLLGVGRLVPRLIVDIGIAWLLWSLRKDWRALVATVVTILGFEVFFKNVYPGALRHDGLILFLLFTIGWFAAARAKEKNDQPGARRIAYGFLPLFLVQFLAMPVAAYKHILYPESASAAYARFIGSNAEYRNAILMAEPDLMMEAMPYYVTNRIYMPRQHGFHYRVYFDDGTRRQKLLTLSQLSETARGLACRYHVPVLLAIQSHAFRSDPAGKDVANYGSVFTWTPPEWNAFRASAPVIAQLRSATTDESYDVYKIGCA
jgi:hypothetical protein